MTDIDFAKFEGHTKGQWGTRLGWDEESIEVFPLRDGPPDVGSWSEIAEVKSVGENDDEVRANAALIAAAPTLLAQLTERDETIRSLREALEPFALEADGFERRYPFSGKHEPLTDDTPLWAGGRRADLKLGNLRRAREALERLK